MSKGHVRARGPGAWELKFDAGQTLRQAGASPGSRRSAARSEMPSENYAPS